MSLDFAEVDIGRSIFEAGQAYVALSRVRTLDGLIVKAFDPASIKAHSDVKKFYENSKKREMIKCVESDSQKGADSKE